LHPHDPKWRARNLLPVVYDDMAECPRFTQALEEWLPDDPGARSLLEEFMGYCLVPDVTKEKALFLVGEGANGKGRFVRVLENLLGKSNVSGLPLMSLRAERTFPTAGLVGKLLNVCTETETSGGAQLDEGWIKALVSGDTVQVERKGRDPFPIRSTARFIIQSNNPPHISDKSEGFWRRLLLVRFPRCFRQEELDLELDVKLTCELPGILNLAIAGVRRLRDRGLFEVTPAMMEALSGYRQENNPLAIWREEKLVQAAPDWSGGIPPRVSSEMAYKSYRDWCRDNGHNAYSRAKFGREMGRLGVPSVQYREATGAKLRGFEGVRLL
jgi:putative DNA primase/helicase